MTRKQLIRFIAVRNKSQFSSNLQFLSDAAECGFKTTALGPLVKIDDSEYTWATPYGTLREKHGKLALEN